LPVALSIFCSAPSPLRRAGRFFERDPGGRLLGGLFLELVDELGPPRTERDEARSARVCREEDVDAVFPELGKVPFAPFDEEDIAAAAQIFGSEQLDLRGITETIEIGVSDGRIRRIFDQ